MPLSRRPVAWLASLAVLMNLFVVPLSQALTTQERASLLLGGFCSTSSDSLLRLKLGAALKDIDLPDDHEPGPAPLLLRRRRRHARTGRLLAGIAAGAAGQPGP